MSQSNNNNTTTRPSRWGPTPPTPLSPKHSSPHHSYAKTRDLNRKLTPRIERIRTILSSVQHTLYIRTLLFQLHKLNSFYCPSCSSLSLPGTCGPTCPLLRPNDKIYCGHGIDAAWVRHANEITDMYEDITEDMRVKGDNASGKTVGRWEKIARVLRADTCTWAEKCWDEGWWMVRDVDLTCGMDGEWCFEGRWGRGVGIVEDEAPGIALRSGVADEGDLGQCGVEGKSGIKRKMLEDGDVRKKCKTG
ncbi:hypothetical protein J1614_006034 [Plenodomus biglobosus]|nr:hypothetical protein J1614_006034 [Plenodomus biglobosus]